VHVLILDFNFFEYTISLANALVDQVRATLLVPEGFKRVASALSSDVEAIYFDKPRLHSLKNLKMLQKIVESIMLLKPDVVHLVAVNPWLNIMLLFYRPFYLVTTIHDPVRHLGDSSQRKIPQVVRDMALYRSHKIITHAEALKKIILQRFDLPGERVAVIPHGEFSIYRHWSKGEWIEQEGNILFFGRIWPYKGLEYLIAAGPAIYQACPQARIVIAGKGEEFERYKAMMIHPEQFEVLNYYIPHTDITRLFQQASVVVLPYVEASQSGVIPLAYAFGRPVVATTVGGIPEVVSHGKDGLLVPARDSSALAEALITLLKDRDTRLQMGRNALIKSNTLLSWASIARLTEDVYRSVGKSEIQVDEPMHFN
jgi:glycosyltransferase involved in cell wall biosynthesis